MTQEDPSRTFGFIVTDTARLLRRNFNRRIQSLKLTRAQWGVLTHLHRQNGLRQTDLACLLEIQPISLTRLIDRMEQNGWVERRSDPQDRRANRLYLTEKVAPITARLRELAHETREEALEGLSPEQREQLIQTLSLIRSNLCRHGHCSSKTENPQS